MVDELTVFKVLDVVLQLQWSTYSAVAYDFLYGGEIGQSFFEPLLYVFENYGFYCELNIIPHLLADKNHVLGLRFEVIDTGVIWIDEVSHCCFFAVFPPEDTATS